MASEITHTKRNTILYLIFESYQVSLIEEWNIGQQSDG